MNRIFLIFTLSMASTFGDVVINEISAIQTERLLRWDSNDQPYAGPGHPWWSASFDDSNWLTGETPIGFNEGTIFAPRLPTNLKAILEGVSPSVYTRHVFPVDAASAESSGDLILTIIVDDGFILWLNGRERGRRNLGVESAHIYFDQVAYREAELPRAKSDIVLGKAADLLIAGENTLAFQLVNYDLISPMGLDFELSVGETTLVPFGSTVRYLPGLHEPSADVFEPAALADGPSDWIELHNQGSEEIDLTNWSLTDDEDDPSKWSFPDGTSIPASGYLVVMADNPENPIPAAHYLHAAFRLSSRGDYIGLFDETGDLQSEIAPVANYHYHSYGLASDGSTLGYFSLPTPGTANTGPIYSGRVEAPDFDIEGGFFDSDVTITLTTSTDGAMIRYTTDGTEPTEMTGIAYTEPIQLMMISDREGHVLRARAFHGEMIPSDTITNTYLIGQDPRIRTASTLIFAADLSRSLYDPYGALAINGGSFSGDSWKAREEDAYNNVVNRGRAYERPIHAEFYFADGSPGFRSNSGVRIAASNFSRPRMVLNRLNESPWQDGNGSVEKPSFNLYFRNEYGNPDVTLPFHGENDSVSTFEQFRVRAGKNDSRNPFIMDELMRRLSKAMGQPASTGVINTLYVNGELKGIYNMTERVREPFLRAHHGADPDSEWDILQYEGDVFTVDTVGNPRNNIASGDKVAWEDLLARLEAPETLANWEAALELVDAVNIADYFLFNIYTAMWDWPHNNWILTRERSSRGRFRAYVWDAEGGIGRSSARNASTNIIDQYILGTQEGSLSENGTEGELRDLWRGLTRWEEFRLLFADRINRHLFNGGPLDDRDFDQSILKKLSEEVVDEYDDLLDFVFGQKAIGTHARNWATTSGGNPRRSYLFGPNREAFRNHDLWPTVMPPEFTQFGGRVDVDFSLGITSEQGTIYYTTNGTDPRLPGGEPNPHATPHQGNTVGIVLTEAVTVAARSFHEGLWSAVTRAEFTVGTGPASSNNIAITELLYRPADASLEESAAGYDDGDAFEFLRLKNTGAQAIDLRGVRFVDGITFDFATSTIRSLAPGGEALLVSNLEAFRHRFGSGHDAILAGQYRGRLNNGGEVVQVIDASGNTLHEFTYEVEEPWPDLAALDGHSIQITEATSSPAEGAHWKASSQVGGTLGEAGDRFSLADWHQTNVSIQEVGNDRFLVMQYTCQPDDRAVDVIIQTSDNLITWSDHATIDTTLTNQDGSITTTMRGTAPVERARYARLKVSLQP